jgi:hypothetical protein
VAQGKGPDALTTYRQSLRICEALSAHDPVNAGWQRDLSVSYDKIGDVLVAQGDGASGLTAYRKGLGIREALAARDPANAKWRRDLIVSLMKVGAVTGEKGYASRALDLALSMQQRGTLAPRDAGLIEQLKKLAGR